MNDHACILIWDTYMRMGHNIVPYMYTGYPIRVWDVPYVYGPIYAYGAEHVQHLLARWQLLLILQKKVMSISLDPFGVRLNVWHMYGISIIKTHTPLVSWIFLFARLCVCVHACMWACVCMRVRVCMRASMHAACGATQPPSSYQFWDIATYLNCCLTNLLSY